MEGWWVRLICSPVRSPLIPLLTVHKWKRRKSQIKAKIPDKGILSVSRGSQVDTWKSQIKANIPDKWILPLSKDLQGKNPHMNWYFHFLRICKAKIPIWSATYTFYGFARKKFPYEIILSLSKDLQGSPNPSHFHKWIRQNPRWRKIFTFQEFARLIFGTFSYLDWKST